MLPLQAGVPGGPELLVALVSFVLPVALLVYVFYSLGTKASASRVDELERRVGRLDRRLEELERDGEGPD